MSTSLLPGVPDMRGRVLKGLMWVGASQAGAQLTRAVVAIFVARLLTPGEYGLAALALVFASLVMVFNDLGLGAALVQRKQLTEVDRSTAFWTSAAAGVIFTVAGVALAGPIADVYGQPSAAPLLVALSFTFVVSALGAPQQWLMLRDMDFRRVETSTMIGGLLGGAAAIFAAVHGSGAWAIIVQQLVTVGVTTLLFVIRSPWRPSLTFSGASLRDLGGFGAYLLGQRLLWYGQVNGDSFLIGRFLGPASLGIYAVAYNTMLVPASKLGGPLQRVFSPAFSRIQDEPERIAAAWARVGRLLAAVSMPALGGLVVVAPDFIPLVLGEQWSAAVPVVQVLAWVGVVQAVQAVNMDILLARNRPRTMFRFSVVMTTCHLAAFSAGLHWGVVGVAVGYAISTTLVEPAQTVLAARTLGVSPMVFVRAIWPVFQAAAGMCVAVLLVRVGLEDVGVGAAGRLVACIGAGALVYAALCAWRVPELLDEVRGIVRRRSPRPAPLVAATAEG
jgi:O-antigen/teichoic acid export membrane protein